MNATQPVPNILSGIAFIGYKMPLHFAVVKTKAADIGASRIQLIQ